MVWKRIGLVLASLALSLGLCEAAMRLFWTNPYRNEPTDVMVEIEIHHPYRSLPIDRSAIGEDPPTVLLRTDARGYVLPSRRFDEPDLTIAFLGGSTTECMAVSEEKRFPARVSTLLEARGLRVNALNAAKSGNTIQDSLNVLLNHVVEDRPDVAVMMHAVNDIGVLDRFASYRSRSGAPVSVRTVAIWLLQAASARSSLVGALRKSVTLHAMRIERQANKPRARAALHSAEFVHRLRAFVGIARAFGIVPVLMTQPLVSMDTPLTPDWADVPSQGVFNQLIRDVAEQEEVALVDLDRHILEQVEGWEEPMRVFYDGAHVTADGSRIYAEYITRRLLDTVLRPPLVEVPGPSS
jgi:hypothetical protein